MWWIRILLQKGNKYAFIYCLFGLTRAIDYYPFEYGGYQTQYFDSNASYSLNFCNIQKVEVINLDAFSNGDIVADLSISHFNLDESSAMNATNIIVRIDYETGTIIWAKSYFFSGNNLQFVTYNLKVQNDIVWTINYPVDPNNYSNDGVIIIYDMNGNILDSYYLCRDEFNGSLNCQSALFLENNNFIAKWYSQGYNSGVGVNLNSILDQTLIKINNQKSTDWITTLDFSNLSGNFAEIMVHDKYVP